MATRSMRVPILYRDVPIDLNEQKVDEEKRVIRDMTFATNNPVRRWFGSEELVITVKAADLRRLRNVGSILLNHDGSKPVAMPFNIVVDQDGGRLASDGKFGTKQLAADAFTDVRERIIRGISVGYIPEKMTLIEKSENGPNRYRIDRYQVLEFSLTPIPLDPKSKVSAEFDAREFDALDEPQYRETDPVFLCEVTEPDPEPPTQKKEASMPPEIATPTPTPTPPPDLDAIRAEAIKGERERRDVITAIGKRHKLEKLAEKLCADGTKTEQNMKDAVLAHMVAQEAAGVPLAQIAGGQADPIGMTAKQVSDFRLFRLVNALANPADRRSIDDAAFELDACTAQAEKLGRKAKGVFLPNEFLFGHPDSRNQQRDVTKAGEGTDLVTENVLGSAFIDLLRNNTVAMRMATILPGLRDTIILPRLSGGAAATWVTEQGSNEQTATFDQVKGEPHTLTAFTDVTRLLLIQSSVAVENQLRNDLASAMGLAMDLGIVAGTGASNQPTGILNTSGIGTVTTGGTLTWANWVELWTDVAGANANVNRLAFLTSSIVAGTLMTTEKFSGSGKPILNDENFKSMGARVEVSNQVPNTAGGRVAMYGNWADDIFCLWDTLDLLVDPYTGGTAGTLRIILRHEADNIVRHPASFSAMQDLN